jgi:hypothetical protein
MRANFQARQAIARTYGPQIASTLGSYESDTLDALKEIYGSNVLINIGLPAKQVEQIIGKAAYYYRTKAIGRKRESIPTLAEWIARDMKFQKGTPAYSSVTKVLFFLEGIGPDRPVLNTYLSPREITIATRAESLKVAAESVGKKLAEGAQDTLIESLDVVTKGIGKAAGAANENLPWYLKPKVLLPVAGIAALIIYGGPLLSMLPKPKARPEYRPNPISKKEAARAKYVEFHGMPPKKRKTIPSIDTTELVELGKALEIGYRSKKWTGKPANYLHEFGKGVSVYTTPDGKALIISGGALDVKDRGIMG